MPNADPLHDAPELTRHIETRHHARHREQLAELATLAEKVEMIHFGDPGVPYGLATLLERMIGEMDGQMKKEELVLSPAIRNGLAGLGSPIPAMRADHDSRAEEIAAIRCLTAGLTLPEGACQSWAALYAGLADFITDLEEHIRLENDVLFPMDEPFDASAA